MKLSIGLLFLSMILFIQGGFVQFNYSDQGQRDWDPDAGVIPSYSQDAQVIASSNPATANNVIDGKANTHWMSDAPFPNGFIPRRDQNILLDRLAQGKFRSSKIESPGLGTDGRESTEAKILAENDRAWVAFDFDPATSLYALAARIGQLSAPVDVQLNLSDGKIMLVGSFLPSDYDQLTRIKVDALGVRTITLSSSQSFSLREVAALAEPAREFVTLDFGAPKIIGWVETRHWAGEATALSTGMFLSADNKKWYKVADLDPSALHSSSTKIDPPVKARFLKLEHSLVDNDWNKVFLWKINVYDEKGPFGAMPKAQPNPKSFDELLGVNAIWGWGHKEYSDLLEPEEGAGLYNQLASHARNYHFVNWEVTDPDHTPDYQAMVAGKGTEAQAWLNWDREYRVWKERGLKVHTAVKFGEIDAVKWDHPYESAYKYGYAFARHFGPTHGNGLVDVMEIGNEPWYYDAELYRNILKGMAQGAKAADHKMFVLPCALHAAFPQNEEEGLFKNYMGARITPDIAPYLDGLNVHYYSWTHRKDGQRISVHPEHPYSEIRGILNDLRFRDKNMPGKPVFVTEWGWDSDGAGENCTHNECVSEEAQAIYAIRGMLMFARLGVQGLTWFFYANEGPNSSLFSRSGLTGGPSQAFQKKRSFVALQAFIQQLGDTHFLQTIREDQEV